MNYILGNGGGTADPEGYYLVVKDLGRNSTSEGPNFIRTYSFEGFFVVT